MEAEKLIYRITEAVAAAKSKRNKLIIVNAKKAAFQKAIAAIGLDSINLNLLLSEKLLEIPVSKRSRIVDSFIKDIIKSNNMNTLALSHYELLFLPELKQDPIRLFEDLSKERVILIVWEGRYENNSLYYAEPWHREYREYKDLDAIIVQGNI